ncbi:UNVERIFIED_CONTAM: hypothetical protein Sindi_1444300 [Sesamum indicum]
MAPLVARDEAAMVAQTPTALNRPLMTENQQPSLQVTSAHPPMMLSELHTADVVSVDVAPVHVTADATSQLPTFSSTEIFVGNMPLQPCSNFMNCHDKIVNVFHNSSRKILTYVPPMMQNGEIIVGPTLDVVRDGSRRWNATVVGYFLGKRPYFHHVKDYSKSIWPLLAEVTATTNGFFFFRFKTIVAMEEVIEGGPWLFQRQPIVLQKLEPGMVLRKLKHTQVPIWVKLRHLPVELWNNDGLSTVASGIGRPLYPDVITRACTRLDFARVYVMLDINAKLPKHLVIMSSTEEGGEIACKVDVEYEWLPLKCTTCMSLGHATKDCPSMKVPKPPVNVYGQKARVQPPIAESSKVVEEDKNNSCGDINQQPIVSETPSTPVAQGINKGRYKGKELVIFNTFGAFNSLNDADDTIRGPKISSPARGDHVKRCCVERAWSEQKGPSAGTKRRDQFVHCRVTIRALHTDVIISVMYGATEIAEQRELGRSLGVLAGQCVDDPWIVGGDFNAVRDLNEVCVNFGDISAMDEFNACIQDTGLLQMPMQGE